MGAEAASAGAGAEAEEEDGSRPDLIPINCNGYPKMFSGQPLIKIYPKLPYLRGISEALISLTHLYVLSLFSNRLI